MSQHQAVLRDPATGATYIGAVTKETWPLIVRRANHAKSTITTRPNIVRHEDDGTPVTDGDVYIERCPDGTETVLFKASGA